MPDFSIKVSGFEQLAELANKFNTSAPNVIQGIQEVVKKKADEIYSIIKSNSPVGKITDSRNYPGFYRDSWRVSYANEAGTIAGFKIWNSAVQAEAIEFGSMPGSKPWPNPTVGRQTGGRGMNQNGRTIYSSGRIWSTQAIGGVFDRSITEKDIDDLTNDIQEVVMNAIDNL